MANKYSKVRQNPVPTSSDDNIELEWEIIADLGFWNYAVQVAWIAHHIIAYRSGKMKMHKIVLIVWDKVIIKINPSDRLKWIITFRLKS